MNVSSARSTHYFSKRVEEKKQTEKKNKTIFNWKLIICKLQLCLQNSNFCAYLSWNTFIYLLGEKKTLLWRSVFDIWQENLLKLLWSLLFFFHFLFNFIETQHLLITVSSIDLVWSHQLSFSLIARNAKESQKHTHTSQPTSINNNAFNFMTVLDQHE